MGDFKWAKMTGEAILLSSIQVSLASVEMSSKFSVINFCKDQETLQNAADALRNYILVASGWMVGTMLVLYSKYGNAGAIAAFIANMLYILWIHISYVLAFRKAAIKYRLKEPSVFF